MYDEHGPGPIDSYDRYAMGLRAPRCNGCEYAKLKWELGEKFYSRRTGTGLLNRLLGRRGLCKWIEVYELGAQPGPKQRKKKYRGVPIKHITSFASIEHSDECWHWKPPVEPRNPWRELWRWVLVEKLLPWSYDGKSQCVFCGHRRPGHTLLCPYAKAQAMIVKEITDVIAE